LIKSITAEDEVVLLIYNCALTVVLTIVLVYLVVRLINQQNNEVMLLLDKEHEAQAKISHSLKEKETMLAEIQHRVKNNLAIITGLLNLQTEKAPCDVSKNLMIESRNRVMSIAMVHERLYRKENLAKIDFKLYLSELVNEVVKSFPSKNQIEIKEEMDNAELEITKAVPIGLILNEAITNALKHAFHEGSEKPKITIQMQTIYDKMQISLSDNGKGFKDLEHREASSLGISLIESLADQIDAKVAFRNNNGATVSLVFGI
jgi:two-component sensor histidine kinase